MLCNCNTLRASLGRKIKRCNISFSASKVDISTPVEVTTQLDSGVNKQLLQDLNEIVIIHEEQKPGFLDAYYFKEDKSVSFWRDFNIASAKGKQENLDSPEGLQKLLPILQDKLVTARIFRDETTIQYWSYHVLRTSYFLALTLGGLLGSRITDFFSNTNQSAETQSDEGAGFKAVMPSGFLFLITETMATFNQDLENIRKGVYNLPWDMTTQNHHQYNPQFIIQTSLQTIIENTRILSKDNNNNNQKKLWLKSNLYPEYYQNTFHYQTDGWMSSFSASIYESSTELVFVGRQDTMQRTTLIPIHAWIQNQYKNKKSNASIQNQYQNNNAQILNENFNGNSNAWIQNKYKKVDQISALEVAAGTGRFATFFRDNYPEVNLTVSDLSPFYLEAARQNMQEWEELRANQNKNINNKNNKNNNMNLNKNGVVNFVQAAAENLPFSNNSFDIVMCVYLFHEIPFEIRVKAINEFSRVLKPGGILVLTDSLQLGDRPVNDNTIEGFGDFNEPYYRSYIQTNFGPIFEQAGLICQQKYCCSVTKTFSAIKPENM